MFPLVRISSSRIITALDLAAVNLSGRTRVLAAPPSCSLSSRKYPKPGSRLGQTSVFVQTGIKIRELPLVVKKVNDVLMISGMDAWKEVVESKEEYVTIDEWNDETKELIEGFNRCFSVHGIFKLLETIPAEEVTPPVAIHALKKIIDLENHVTFQNPEASPPQIDVQPRPASYRGSIVGVRKSGSDSAENNESFLRIAFINMLLDIVYRCRDPKIILEGLEILSRDSFPGDQTVYKERMCEETLVCVSEGIFDLGQLCEAVMIFANFYPDRKKGMMVADKLWSGIMDNSDKINEDNLSTVFLTLPNLKMSRDIIFKMLESKVPDFWQKYQTRHVLEILRVFKDLRFPSTKILQIISQWLTVNIHTLSEEETLAVIYCFLELGYIDSTMIHTMEKYIKMRGCNIQEQDLVATICDYCLEFRVRSKTILAGAGEYFLEHAHDLSTPQIYSITRIFGELDFHPPNGFKFWEIMEQVLETKFTEFPPKEIIDLLISFTYLERYPLNFTRKIFNPYFMDRLHNQAESDVAHSRLKLYFFDSVMMLECKNYSGPYLPVSSNNRLTIFSNMVRSRILASRPLEVPLQELVGDADRVKMNVEITPFVFCDAMIYPSAAASLIKFGKRTNNSQNIAVLVHLPEYYSRDKQTLMGFQAMRKRIIRAMGFKVMDVNYARTKSLKYDREMLIRYLNQMMEEAAAAEKK